MQTATKVTPSAHEDDTAPVTREPWFRLSPQDGWITVILVAICVYLTVLSIQSVTPPWAPGMQVLTATTGAGLVLGYLVVQQGRLPGVLVHSVAIILGIIFAGIQTADTVVGGNRLLLLQHTGIWIQTAALQGGNSSDNTVFLLFLGVLTFLLAYISIWLVVRTRKPWLAVFANGVVLLINLNWASDDKFVFLLLFLLAALLLVVRFTLAENMRQWRARGLRFSPDLSWDFMQAGAIMAVFVLLLAYLLPIGQANAGLQAFASSPQNPLTAVQNRWQALFGGLVGNGPGVGGFDFFSPSLHLQSSVTLPSAQILHYTLTQTTDDPSQYLIAETLDSFDGFANWTSSQTNGKGQDAFQDLVSPSAFVHQNAYNIGFDVSWGAGHPVLAPGTDPAAFSIPTDIQYNARTGAPVAWNASQTILSGQSYVARAFLSTATTADLQAMKYPRALSGTDLGAQYPSSILSTYLPGVVGQIPDVVRTAAATATKGTTTMYDAAVHMEDFLRAGFTYSQTNPKIPDGESAMDWFFLHKVGFCTFFATAMALMARSIGIPARIAIGFSRGSYDPDKKAYVVKGTDAHAWTQLYFGKYGWVDFEPTSSFSKFSRPVEGSTSAITPVATGGTNTANATPSVNGHFKDTTNDGGLGGSTGESVGRVGIGLSVTIALLLAIAALFMLWWRLLYRTLSPTAAAFARVTRLGAWAGAPPRRSQTPNEYADELGTIIPEQRESLKRISDLYARERWGGGLDTGPASELQRLYEQVRVAATSVIARRSRELPSALINGIRRLTRRGDA